jgi:hypothetical protein
VTAPSVVLTIQLGVDLAFCTFSLSRELLILLCLYSLHLCCVTAKSLQSAAAIPLLLYPLPINLPRSAAEAAFFVVMLTGRRIGIPEFRRSNAELLC